jgi:hypothetical protein
MEQVSDKQYQAGYDTPARFFVCREAGLATFSWQRFIAFNATLHAAISSAAHRFRLGTKRRR